MNGNATQISGNLASDPELKFTPSGTAVATLNIGVSERRKNSNTGEWEDSGVTWYRTIVWGQPAEHVAESLTRGMRVMVNGTMRQRSYEDKSGETRYVWELTADEIGASLRFGPVDVKRVNRSKSSAPDRSDPWAGIDASTERPDSETGSERASEPATVATGQEGAEATGARKRSRKAPSRATTPA